MSPTEDLEDFTGSNGGITCDTETGHLLYEWLYVAPPVIIGVWSMACVLRQRIDYFLRLTFFILQVSLIVFSVRISTYLNTGQVKM